MEGGVVRQLNFVPPSFHFQFQIRNRGDGIFKYGSDAAVLHRLMGVAAGHHRDTQLPAQGIGLFFRTDTVQSQILSVKVQEGKTLQLLLGQFRHMPRCPIGVTTAHQHGVLRKQIQQLGKGQEVPFLLVRLQLTVHLQNSLHGADGQNVASFSYVGFHARENPQAIFQFQRVPCWTGHRGQIGVQVLKLQCIEMFR